MVDYMERLDYYSLPSVMQGKYLLILSWKRHNSVFLVFHESRQYTFINEHLKGQKYLKEQKHIQ